MNGDMKKKKDSYNRKIEEYMLKRDVQINFFF